jgi:hypothetical protein
MFVIARNAGNGAPQYADRRAKGRGARAPRVRFLRVRAEAHYTKQSVILSCPSGLE